MGYVLRLSAPSMMPGGGMSADVLHEMVRQMERKQGRLHANFKKVYHTLTSGTVSKNPKTQYVDRLEPPPP